MKTHLTKELIEILRFRGDADTQELIKLLDEKEAEMARMQYCVLDAMASARKEEKAKHDTTLATLEMFKNAFNETREDSFILAGRVAKLEVAGNAMAKDLAGDFKASYTAWRALVPS